jgi:predicted ArsR family transcriptional regulator
VPGPEPADDDIVFLRQIKIRPEGFATASDIVDEVEVGQKQTRNRLNQLVDDDLLNVGTVGTTKVYWLSDEGKQALMDAES